MFPKNLIQFVLSFVISMLICLPIWYLTLNGIIGRDLGVNLYFAGTVIFFLVLVHFINYKNKTKIIYNAQPFNFKFLLFIILIVWILQTLIFIPLNHYFFYKGFYKVNFYYFLGALILAPIFEEIIFRNILLNSLLNNYSKIKSIVLSAILFGLIHGNLFQIISATILGLLFGLIYVENKNIAYTIILHFFNNTFVFLVKLLIVNFSTTLFFQIGIVLNIFFSISLLYYANRRYGLSLLKLIRKI